MDDVRRRNSGSLIERMIGQVIVVAIIAFAGVSLWQYGWHKAAIGVLVLVAAVVVAALRGVI